MEILDLSNCTTSQEVLIKVKERVKSVALNDLIEDLRANFVFHEEATRRIYLALATGNNVILHGPGGFGKSVLVKAVCELLGLPVVYKVGYKGMMPDELLGIPDMKLLMNESRYETAFENSVFGKPGILILEEFLDADPSTAAALKDILTSRGLREGVTKKESLISSVIITGNKSPENLATDDSTQAFYMERFPIRHQMIWPSFYEDNYLLFYKVYFGAESFEENKDLFRLLSRLCASNPQVVSPRIAKSLADIALESGVENIDIICGIDSTMVTSLKYQLQTQRELTKEEELLESLKGVVTTLINDLKDARVEKVSIVQTKLLYVQGEVLKYGFTESSQASLQTILELIEYGLGQSRDLLAQRIDVGELREIFPDTDES